MPYASEKQRRFMYSQHPDCAIITACQKVFGNIARAAIKCLGFVSIAGLSSLGLRLKSKTKAVSFVRVGALIRDAHLSKSSAQSIRNGKAVPDHIVSALFSPVEHVVNLAAMTSTKSYCGSTTTTSVAQITTLPTSPFFVSGVISNGI
jgi:hypothetical protein